MQAFEESHSFTHQGSTEEDQSSRHASVTMLVSLARNMGLLEETIHDSVLLLDRLCQGTGAGSLATNSVFLAAVALLAAQQGEPCGPSTPACLREDLV